MLRKRREFSIHSTFEQHFRYANDVHKYNTRYASKANLYKSRYRTNIGKQTTKAMAIDIWQQLPMSGRK